MPDWDDYQEEVADFFRSTGLEAATNETIQGIRTSHNVDVAVRTNHVGFDLLWLVECKYWKSAVSKLHVLALREIVTDTGADRGIIMAENGYQSGAMEAARLTNVQLMSLAELSITAQSAVNAAQLQLLLERVETCHVRYWDLSAEIRITYGLRPDMGQMGYSSLNAIEAARAAINAALIGRIPIEDNNADWFAIQMVKKEIARAQTASEIISLITPIIEELEKRLDVTYNTIASMGTPNVKQGTGRFHHPDGGAGLA